MKTSIEIIDELNLVIKDEKNNIDRWIKSISEYEKNIREHELWDSDPIVKKYSKNKSDVSRETFNKSDVLNKISSLNNKIVKSEKKIILYKDIIEFINLNSEMNNKESISISEYSEIDEDVLTENIETVDENIAYNDASIYNKLDYKNIMEKIEKAKKHLLNSMKFIRLDSLRTELELQLTMEELNKLNIIINQIEEKL